MKRWIVLGLVGFFVVGFVAMVGWSRMRLEAKIEPALVAFMAGDMEAFESHLDPGLVGRMGKGRFWRAFFAELGPLRDRTMREVKFDDGISHGVWVLDFDGGSLVLSATVEGDHITAFQIADSAFLQATLKAARRRVRATVDSRSVPRPGIGSRRAVQPRAAEPSSAAAVRRPVVLYAAAPPPQLGEVRFHTLPRGADVRVEDRTCRTPCTLNLPVGEYVAHFSKDGFDTDRLFEVGGRVPAHVLANLTKD